MSWVKDNIFGGAAKDAARDQQYNLREAQELTRQATEQARGDIFELFPQAQQAQQQGFTDAIAMLSGALPQQAQLAGEGNMMAQQNILAGMPQFQNAILGNPVDYSQFQTYQPTIDFSQFNTELAPLGTPGTPVPQQPNVPSFPQNPLVPRQPVPMQPSMPGARTTMPFRVSKL